MFGLSKKERQAREAHEASCEKRIERTEFLLLKETLSDEELLELTDAIAWAYDYDITKKLTRELLRRINNK